MRTLLIDGDILVYMFASVVEQVDEDGRQTSLPLAKKLLRNWLNRMMSQLDGDRFMIAVSGPTPQCFRMEVLPSYKGDRVASDRPLCYDELRDWLITKYNAKIVPNLEADDVLGIWSTTPGNPYGEAVIVSRDKDFFSIPGFFYKTDQESLGIQHITAESADRYHLYQTLLGDKTDNYKGCPGIGPYAAEKLLSSPSVIIPYEHTLLRGPRKGETEIRHREEPTGDLWEAVVSHFAFFGYSEEDALVQARCARILRYDEFDYRTRKPILWTPDKLKRGT